MQTSISTTAAATRPTQADNLAGEQLLFDRRESRLRLSLGVLLTLCGLVGLVGVAWDIQWHSEVGRDSFFTPPHLMLYSGVGLAGLVSLAFVLISTWRYYHQAPAVTDATTTRVLGFFHAPLGFVATGFGMLTALIAAPLDDYWHQLYGVDVTIWAPFHVMGLLGGIIGMLGILYIYASEAGRWPQQGQPVRRYLGFTAPQIGLLVQANVVIGFLFLLAIPGLQSNYALHIGGMSILLHEVFLALIVPAAMIAVLRATTRVGAATALAVICTAFSLLIGAFVAWANPTLLVALGENYRPEAPYSFIIAQVSFPVSIIVVAILVDYIYWRAQQVAGFSWNSLTLAIIASVVAALLLAIVEPIWRLRQHIQLGMVNHWEQVLYVLPAVAVAALLAAVIGKGFGTALRVTKEYADA